MKPMLRIRECGLLNGGDEQVQSLVSRADVGEIVIPSSDMDLDLTHWWDLVRDGQTLIYVGTPETFARWQEEEAVTVVMD